MTGIKTYKDLFIWKKGMELTELVYQLVNEFPKEEIYALTNQIKRASVSIPSNIAEGYGRNTSKSYSQFIKISRGSLYELETQLILAENLGFIRNKELLYKITELIQEEGKMINSFIKKIEISNLN